MSAIFSLDSTKSYLGFVRVPQLKPSGPPNAGGKMMYPVKPFAHTRTFIASHTVAMLPATLAAVLCLQEWSGRTTT